MTIAEMSAVYTLSLHWSVAQFGGGMDEITPTNDVERVFAVVVFLICFLIAAVIVSRLTSCMTQLYLISSRQSAKLWIVRRYLHLHEISHQLALRIQHNAQHALSKERFSVEDTEEILNVVSEPLRIELHFEIFS